MFSGRYPVTAPEELDLLWTLRDARQQLGLSQRQVAERVPGFTSATELGRYEVGAQAPSLRKLRSWARSLGYSLVLVPVESGTPAVSPVAVGDVGQACAPPGVATQ